MDVGTIPVLSQKLLLLIALSVSQTGLSNCICCLLLPLEASTIFISPIWLWEYMCNKCSWLQLRLSLYTGNFPKSALLTSPPSVSWPGLSNWRHSVVFLWERSTKTVLNLVVEILAKVQLLVGAADFLILAWGLHMCCSKASSALSCEIQQLLTLL